MAEAAKRSLLALRLPPPRMMRRLIGAGAMACIVLVWWLATSGLGSEDRWISPVILPSPGEVLRSFPVLLNERGLLQSIAATLKRVLIGFGLAALIGVPLGIIAGSWRVVESAAAPLALFGRNLPVAALIPLTILWFGIDETQKVMFIFIACAPFVYSDAVTSITSVPDRYVETAQTLGARPWQIVTKVLVPLALPDIITSLRFQFGLALGYVMLAEAIATPSGLGVMLNNNERMGNIEQNYALLFVIALLAFVIDFLIRFFQRGVFQWRRDL